MPTPYNRCYSPAHGARLMAVIGILALLAAGLWLVSPLWSVGPLRATNLERSLPASQASWARAVVVTTTLLSEDGGAAGAGVAADAQGAPVFLPQVAVSRPPATLIMDGPWTSLPTGAATGLVLDAETGALTLRSDMTNLAFVLQPDAEQNSFGNAVWNMASLDGRLYLGYGDSYNNRGPVDIVSYNPLSGTVLHEMYDIPEEGAGDSRGAPDGRLYVAGGDPRETWEFGNFYVNSGRGWEKRRTIYKGVHVNRVVSFHNRLYAAYNSDWGTDPVSYLFVLVSSDNGSSWAYERVAPGEGGQSGVFDIEVITHTTGSFLYAVVQDWGGNTGDHLVRFDGQRWEEIRVTDPRGVFSNYRLMAFGDKLLVAGYVNAPDNSWWGQAVYALDGRTQTEVTFLQDKPSRFCAVDDGWLYCAAREANPWLEVVYNVTLYRTRDARTWETVAPVTLPPGVWPQSLGFSHGRLYVGASSAYRWYIDGGFRMWPRRVYPIATGTLHWDAQVPDGAGLSLQIRTAMENSDAILNAQPLVGPDGTEQTAFTVSGQALHSRHMGHIYLQLVVRKTPNGDGQMPTLKWVALHGDNGTVRWAVDEGQGLYTAANSTDPAGAAYVSPAFGTGQPIAGAHLYLDGSTPAQATLRFQVRSALTQEQLSGRTFVGPDGTATTFYGASGQSLWAGHDGDKLIQYRALLTSLDPARSPFLRRVVLAPRSNELARFSVEPGSPAAWIAGASYPVTVTAQLSGGRLMPVNGRISLSAVVADDGEGVPVEPAQVTLVNGVASVNVSLQRAVSTQICAELAGVRTCSPPIAVQAGPADTISMTTDLPAPQPNWAPVGNAGQPFGLALAILDRYGNVVTGYTGTVHCERWSWQSQGDVLPPYTFQPSDQGVHRFPAVVLADVGEWNLLGHDAAEPRIAGTTSVNIQAAPPAAN